MATTMIATAMATMATVEAATTMRQILPALVLGIETALRGRF
jgi:hypothetical protein